MTVAVPFPSRFRFQGQKLKIEFGPIGEADFFSVETESQLNQVLKLNKTTAGRGELDSRKKPSSRKEGIMKRKQPVRLRYRIRRMKLERSLRLALLALRLVQVILTV